MAVKYFRRLALVTPLLSVLGLGEILHAADAAGQEAPLLDDGVMIRVPVSAFGKTLYCQVDTGFTVSALDAGYRPVLGGIIATVAGESPLSRVGSLSLFQSPDLTIAGRLLNLHGILCLDLNIARMISGQACDGILGLDGFAGGVITLDFEHNQLIQAGRVPDIIQHQYPAIPLQRSAQYYSLEVLINQHQRLQLMIDTGDSSSLSLNPEGWRAVFGAEAQGLAGATIADSANHVVRSRTGVIGRLAVGNLNYTNLHATFTPNPALPSHLGLGFFRRHTVTFDFPHRRCYLQPRPDYSRPDREDLSGLHLLRVDGETLVYSVDNDSPASLVGLQAQDLIAAVNGQNASSLTMWDIRTVLQTGDGDKVALHVRRGKSEFDTILVLKAAL